MVAECQATKCWIPHSCTYIYSDPKRKVRPPSNAPYLSFHLLVDVPDQYALEPTSRMRMTRTQLPRGWVKRVTSVHDSVCEPYEAEKAFSGKVRWKISKDQITTC